jgi:hypothetical protein
MPLTDEGEKVLAAMKAEYGPKKGEEVFYASINAGKPGSKDWHVKSEGKRLAGHPGKSGARQHKAGMRQYGQVKGMRRAK